MSEVGLRIEGACLLIRHNIILATSGGVSLLDNKPLYSFPLTQIYAVMSAAADVSMVMEARKEMSSIPVPLSIEAVSSVDLPPALTLETLTKAP